MAKLLTTVDFSNRDQVTSPKLDEIIGGASFGPDAVVGTTLAVVGGQIKVGTITASEMGALSIATGSLQDASVTTPKIAGGAVTYESLANGSVSGIKIAVGGVLFSSLNAGAFANQSTMESQSGNYIVSPRQVINSPAAVKAYAEIGLGGTGRTIYPNSFGIDSVTRTNSTNTTFSLTNQMSSANYTVIVSVGYNAGTPAVGSAVHYQKTSTGFRVLHPAESTGLTLTVSVFGKINA